MSLLQSIRNLFGLKSEIESSPIESLEKLIGEEIQLQEEIKKAESDYNELVEDLNLKIQACDTIIEKGEGENYIKDNKQIFLDRLQKVTDQYIDNVYKFATSLKEKQSEKQNLETEILQKAITTTALLSSEEQKEINTLIRAWEVTGEIDNEICDSQLKAIVKAIEIVTLNENELQKASPEQKKKMKKVMDEFKAGKLKSSSGETVTNRDQAIAIGLSEAGLSKAESIESIKEIKYEEPENLEGHYANVIVKRNGKILFLKRAKDKVIAPGGYCLPGGHIDEGETIQEAGLRELKEESALVANYAWIAGKAKCEDGKWAFYMYADPDGDPMLLDSESENIAWMNEDEWEEADLIFDLKDHLLALECRNEIAVKDIPEIKKAEFALEESEQDILIKGRKAEIGEKRDWGGVEYVKTNHGWIKTKHTDEEKKKKKDKEFKHTTDQLVSHAENTSSEQLKKIVDDESKEQHLRDAAKRELERREEKKKSKMKPSKK